MSELDLDIAELTKRLKGAELRLDAPMKEYTSFKIGGDADVLMFANGTEEVLYAISCAEALDIPCTVIGMGSNLLIRDGGIRGLVIRIGDGMDKICFEENRVRAMAGTRLTTLVTQCIEKGLGGGIENLAGIPGSVGGAVAMNAGAFSSEIMRHVRLVKVINPDLYPEEVEILPEDYSYRWSKYSTPDYIVLEACFELEADEGMARDRMLECMRARKEKQPVGVPSAGSVFKRPEGYFAGALIDQAGLKGLRVGGACVSELHAGFIVNDQNATARDVIELISIIKEKVFIESGVSLEQEIKIIGED